MDTEATVTIAYREDSLDEALAEQLRCGDPLAYASVREGETVLAHDCSDGAELLRLAGRVGTGGRVLGIFATEETLRGAAEAAAAAGARNIELRRGPLEDLPVPSSSVDWVIVRGSVSECGGDLPLRRPRMFAEIVRVLKPGGTALVSDLVASEPLPQWIARSRDLDAACLTRAVPEREYVAGLRRGGLVDVTVVERRFPGIARVRRLLASGALPVPQDLDDLGLARFAATIAAKTHAAKFLARKPGVDGLPRVETSFRKGGALT